MDQSLALTPITQSQSHYRYRKFMNVFMLALAGVAAVIAVAALMSVLGYLVIKGAGALNLGVFIDEPVPQGTPGGGLRNGIIGTLILLGLGSIIGIPLGIMGGIYQLEKDTRLSRTIRFFTDVLNSIPSIVIGLFAYVIVVLPTAQMNPGHAFSAFAGGVALGILMIPTVMRTSEEILRLVPIALRDASLALGASRWRTMWSVTLPAAREGIVTGVMLAMARIAGETAPLLFTAFGNLHLHNSLSQLFEPIDALPLNIYNYATSPYENLHQLALAGAIILIAIIFVLSLVARFALSSKLRHSAQS
jgi:phosphate transport system permease protein